MLFCEHKRPLQDGKRREWLGDAEIAIKFANRLVTLEPGGSGNEVLATAVRDAHEAIAELLRRAETERVEWAEMQQAIERVRECERLYAESL